MDRGEQSGYISADKHRDIEKYRQHCRRTISIFTPCLYSESAANSVIDPLIMEEDPTSPPCFHPGQEHRDSLLPLGEWRGRAAAIRARWSVHRGGPWSINRLTVIDWTIWYFNCSTLSRIDSYRHRIQHEEPNNVLDTIPHSLQKIPQGFTTFPPFPTARFKFRTSPIS